MKCISPITLKNQAKNATKSLITVPCGKCVSCLKNRRADWSFRISQELSVSNSAFFITFTYNEETVPWQKGDDGVERLSLRKSDFQSYMKNLRNKISVPIRFYCCGEYGGDTERPHYHAIIFNCPANERYLFQSEWKYGNSMCAQITPARIHYITKYMMKDPKKYKGREPPFSVCSKGIGQIYLQNNKYHVSNKNLSVKYNGRTQRLPRYYKDKMFSKISSESIAKSDENKFIFEEITLQEAREKAGYNPALYRLEQTENTIRKSKNSLKKEKL